MLRPPCRCRCTPMRAAPARPHRETPQARRGVSLMRPPWSPYSAHHTSAAPPHSVTLQVYCRAPLLCPSWPPLLLGHAGTAPPRRASVLRAAVVAPTLLAAPALMLLPGCTRAASPHRAPPDWPSCPAAARCYRPHTLLLHLPRAVAAEPPWLAALPAVALPFHLAKRPCICRRERGVE